jgi:hypothetical protein
MLRLKHTLAEKKVLTCVHSDRPIVQQAIDIGGVSGTTELVLWPDIATEGVEMPVVTLSVSEHVPQARFSKIDWGGFVIRKEQLLGIQAHATAVRHL